MGAQRSVPGFAVLKALLTAADGLWDSAALARLYMAGGDGAGDTARPLPTHARTLFCLGTSFALLAAAGWAPEPSSPAFGVDGPAPLAGAGAAHGDASLGGGPGGGVEAGQQRAAARLLLGVDVEDVLRPMEAGALFAVEVRPSPPPFEVKPNPSSFRTSTSSCRTPDPPLVTRCPRLKPS